MNLRKGVQRLFLRWPFIKRFLKFGSVGFSGTLVNLSMLYLGQEFLFRSIESVDSRLSISLVLAIFCATVSNFTLNRIWTWADRKEEIEKHYFFQLAQYFVACWLAIAIQFVITKLLAAQFYYLMANVIAIVISSIVNFVVNDAWTFRVSKGPLRNPAFEEDVEC